MNFNWLFNDLSVPSFLVVLLCGFLIGMSKAGLSGFGLVVVPLMAGVFGGKPSTGILLPILVMADIFAVSYYNRHAQWKYVFKLLPWSIGGIIFATVIGKNISDALFNQFISILVIIGVVLMIWQDINKKNINIPDYWWFAGFMGLMGGFATMIGNSSGPIMILYLLAMRLPKNEFIGTGAWFFLIINVLKVPLHVFIWHTIDFRTFSFDLLILPAIVTGAFVGIKVVKIIPERFYKILIIATTVVTAIVIFIRS